MTFIIKNRVSILIALVFCIVWPFSLRSQHVFQAVKIEATQAQKSKLAGQFEKYVLVNIDHKELYDVVNRDPDYTLFRFRVDEDMDYTIDLYQNEIRSASYLAEETTDAGRRPIAKSNCITYSGYQSSGSRQVRLNIEPHRFWGFIETKDGERHFEPLNRFIKDVNASQYISYLAKDVIQGDHGCGAQAQSHDVHSEKPVGMGYAKLGDDCRNLEIATESDYELFQDGITFNDILGNLNMVELIYSTDFSVVFRVVYQHRWLTSNDPYTSNVSGCGAAIGDMDQYAEEWFNNFSEYRRDINVMYSGKDYTGSTIGCAWTGIFGDNQDNDGFAYSESDDAISGAYCVNEWDWGSTNSSNRRTLVAHEMGHSFGAQHDDSGECANIMCSTINSTSNFNSVSESEIEADMNFVSDTANDGRSALRERFFPSVEGGSSFAVAGRTYSANVLNLDGNMIPSVVTGVFGTTSQWNATEKIEMKPGFNISATGILNTKFEIGSCNTANFISSDPTGHSTEWAVAGDLETIEPIAKLYPNPSSGATFVELKSLANRAATVNVFDGLGKLVLEIQIGVSKGKSVLELPTESLTQGLYVVHISYSQGEGQTLKLQKID